MAAPWALWLPPEVAEGLTPESVRLLGVAAALRAAPAVARTQAFVARAVAWRDAPREPSPATPPPQAVAGQAALPTMQAVAGSPRSDSPAPAHQHWDQGAQVGTPEVAPSATLGAERPPEPADAPLSTGPTSRQGGLATRLGGVFYLINLLAWLELPAGWGDDPIPLALGGWGVLEGLARALLGPQHAHYRDDQLWALLASLAGDAPSRDCREPKGRREALLPQQGAAQPPLEGSTNARIALATSTRFRPPDVVLRRVGGSAPAPIELDADAASQLHPAAAWWLARCAPLARSLLARLLAWPELGTLASAEPLLAVPAWVEQSRTHFDITLPLERIALPVRRAGLDCNPGWAPDFGMIVTFHFA
jgi:hypothetical protein